MTYLLAWGLTISTSTQCCDGEDNYANVHRDSWVFTPSGYQSHQCSLSSLGAGGSLFSLDGKKIKTVGSDSSDAISKHFNGIKSQSSAKPEPLDKNVTVCCTSDTLVIAN